jgi:hypothetical protein
MKKNMGLIDKTIRIVIAAIIAILWFTGTIPGTLGTVLLVIAVLFVLTSLIGFCPAYIPFGLNTGKKEKK